MSSRERVLVAMSGGVDSSVAAALLVEKGFDVVGVFMRLGAASQGLHSSNAASLPLAESGRSRGCCSAADADDARVVAGKLGIPFYAVNFEEDFGRLVDYFADEYAVGRTPNPCVMCNQWLKFGRLMEYADAVGAERIATGHYARVDQSDDGVRLRCARHLAKDQSYFLFGVPVEALSRTLFPLGELTKEEVRDHAKRLGLAVHDKPESQDICFAPDRDYAAVVRARRPEAFVGGEIRHVDGRVLGQHDGLPGFTVGQRRGLRVAEGTPVYVRELDAATATVTVGPRATALSVGLKATGVRWIAPQPAGPIRALVRIRYNHAAAGAEIIPIERDRVEVRFDEPQWAVTPGQAAVFYDGDSVIGGGWIDASVQDALA